jgi:DNA-binding response OmpR family regulator
MKYTILIVEDEEEIVRLIHNRIDPERYDVIIAEEGKEALASIARETFDVAVIDIMIPFIDGFEVCTQLRRKNKETLILIVSALGSEENKLKGYDLGADDFIPKPFSPRELMAKIDALIKRRYEMINHNVTILRSITHDLAGKKIEIEGEVLQLTPSEYLIFTMLLANPKNILSRNQLAQEIYDNDMGEIDARGIDTHIYNLRKKIASITSQPIIHTERSLGYTIHAL